VSRTEVDTPLFTKTYDFLSWLAPMTNHFPRSNRATTTRRLLDAAYDFLEYIVDANNLRGRDRLQSLIAASAALDKVRIYIRLAHHWRWMNQRKYEHASRLVAELGRLLGGWQKATRQHLA
jgi:hypothetical protein